MKIAYKHFTEKQLKEKIKELKIQLMKTYGINTRNPLIRKNIRKEIARIKTELKKRRKP